jgi:hypothetical protein
MRRGGWGRGRPGEWAGGEGAMSRQRRARGMCNRLHNAQESSAPDSACNKPAQEQVLRVH